MRSALAPLAALVGLLLAAMPAAGQPTEADVFVSQAIVEFEDGRYEPALSLLRQALALERDHLEALYYTGVVEMALNRPAAAVPFLERARAKAPDDPVIALQLGLAHFVQEQYDRAAPHLEAAFRRDPTLDGLGYYVGFIRYRTKDYAGAVRAFRAGQSRDPEIQQLMRLYTGLALAIQGLAGQAAAELDQAIRLAPGSAVTGSAERIRDRVAAARDRERRLSAELRLGFFYDDNVRVAPDFNVAEPLVPPLRHPRRDSTGELLGLRADYVWLRTARIDAFAGYSFFGTYNNDLPSFNITSHQATLGASHKTTVFSRPALATGQYAFDVIFLDDDEFVRRHTATLAGTVAWTDRHLTQLVARYQGKDFAEGAVEPPAVENRDADNWMVGGLYLFRLAGDRHFLKAGYQFDYEDAHGHNWAYRGHRLLAGGQYTLPWWDVRLRYDVDVHVRDYVYKHAILPVLEPDTRARDDVEVNHAIRAEVPLLRDIAGGAVSLALDYLHTSNNSDLAVFDYTRRVVSLTLIWSY